MSQKRKFILSMPSGYDKLIHYSVLSLSVFGLIVVTSATMGLDASNYMTLIRTIIKQFLFTVAGFAGMLFLANLYTHERAKAFLPFILIGTIVLLIVAWLFPAVSGARAWIRLPIAGIDFTLQPSEFAKISTIVLMLTYLGDLRIQNISTKELLKAPAISVLLFVLIVVFLQKDTGSGVIILAIALILLLIPRHKALSKVQAWLLIAFIAGIALVVFLLSPVGIEFVKRLPLAQYQINRFTSALNPFQDKDSSGYQLIKGLISFASGGLTGVGFGASIHKYMNFPAVNTDYILAIVVEELGMFGFLIIFIGYLIIICRLFNYALKMQSEKSKMALIGVAMYLFIHFVLNVGGVTGLIPLTGVPLLLISAGGSSTMSFMTAIGLAQAIISDYRTNKNQ